MDKEFHVKLWVPGDWNAFFGLFSNVLTNVLVLSGLMLGVIKMPPAIVFGKIIPAVGISLIHSSQIMIAGAWEVAIGYLILAAIFALMIIVKPADVPAPAMVDGGASKEEEA
jgi:hypothetical protein